MSDGHNGSDSDGSDLDTTDEVGPQCGSDVGPPARPGPEDSFDDLEAQAARGEVEEVSRSPRVAILRRARRGRVSHVLLRIEVDDHDDLTPREHEVIAAVAMGLPNKTIATQLGIAENTVRAHLRQIALKLNADSTSTLTLHRLVR